MRCCRRKIESAAACSRKPSGILRLTSGLPVVSDSVSPGIANEISAMQIQLCVLGNSTFLSILNELEMFNELEQEVVPPETETNVMQNTTVIGACVR